jgi:hypothetical protein
MASEKKPSIYQDRGTIGSTKELDEYGVWVKSEPQDLVNDEKDGAGDDFSLHGLDDLPDFDASSAQDSGSADLDFSIPEDDFNLDGGDESAAFSFDAGDQSAGGGEDFSLGDDDLAAGLSLDAEDLDLSLPDEAAEEASAKDDDIENPVPNTDDEGFDEISLEDLLGDVMDELPGEDIQEDAKGTGEGPARNSTDKSTRLLMKIAEELSSIRAELSALKKEFSAARGTDGGEGESHGFFSDAGADDKIALTGDELNNILNTAEFTEESGVNAVEGELAPGFSEGETPAVPVDVSPEAESSPAELSLDDLSATEDSHAEEAELSAAELSLDDLSLDDLNITEDSHAGEAELSAAELSLDDLSLDDLNITEDSHAEEAELSTAELSLDDLSLDDLNITEDSHAEEAELSAAELSLDDLSTPGEPGTGEVELSTGLEEAREPEEFSGAGQPDELGIENPDDSEISLVDLSDDSLDMNFPMENNSAGAASAGEVTVDGEIGEFSLADGEIILEENPVEEAEDSSGELEISLDTPFPEEEISLENFEEDTLDLSNAVIDEPDLGVEIKENPVQEPVLDDIAALDGELSLETEEVPPESPGEAVIEIPGEPDSLPREEGIGEINGGMESPNAEERAADSPPARGNISRGEDLDQIIPEGFVVEELDDEGEADFEGLEEGLDEIPEAELPGEETEAVKRTAGIEAPDEPEVSALPGNFKSELKQVLSYMDQLLESLPEEKIEEFAKSEYFDTYKKLFKELGLA